MNTQDFDFLRRKEIFVLAVCLLALAFSQIALEQQSFNLLPRGKTTKIQPFLTLDHSVFEYLGLGFLLFTAIFLFFHNRAESVDFWRLFGRQITRPLLLVLVQLFVFIIAALLVRFFLPISIPVGEVTQPPSAPQITLSQPTTSSGSSPLGTNTFLELLLNFRTLLLIFILIIPLLVLIWLQRGSATDFLSNQDLEELSPEDTPKQYTTRTILECYYQASNTLEERGAESSPSLTPTEFRRDVVTKKLASTPTIGGITQLFEEAKFSTHQMSIKEVELAKTYAHEIIALDWLVEEGGEEKIKTKEGRE